MHVVDDPAFNNNYSGRVLIPTTPAPSLSSKYSHPGAPGFALWRNDNLIRERIRVISGNRWNMILPQACGGNDV